MVFTKKRYAAYSVNENGKIVKEVKKGIITARRDNCGVLREIFKNLVNCVLDNKSEDEFMYKLYDFINLLFGRGFPVKKFIITKSIKTVMSYAVKYKKTKYFEDHPEVVDRILEEGRVYCSKIAQETLAEVKKKMGLQL